MLVVTVESNCVEQGQFSFKKDNDCLKFLKQLRKDYEQKYPTKDIYEIKGLRSFTYQRKQELVKECIKNNFHVEDPYLKIKIN